MKFISEYRDKSLIHTLREHLHTKSIQGIKIMEVCGGQTHSIMHYGIHEMLPKGLQLIHGPGCPVCVTPEHLIDQAIMLAQREKHIVCSFGDMLRVRGSQQSLSCIKALCGSVRVILSPLDAVVIAEKNPSYEVTLFAVGFETTAPATAMAAVIARKKNLKNFSLLSSHVLVPPAIEYLLSQKDCQIDGFLAAGHVCTIEGNQKYSPIAEKYQVPIVITGFEPADILRGLYRCVDLLEKKHYTSVNEYTRCVKDEGNVYAQRILSKVFTPIGRRWRGIGWIADSGLQLSEEFSFFDAEKRFGSLADQERETGCISGQILQGKKKPSECPHFAKSCSPMTPLGAPMVSSEGACSAYFKRHVPDHAR